MTATTTHGPISVHDVFVLSDIVNAASKSARVVFIGENGEQQRGVARHIVKSPEDIGFIVETDVRDAYLRVTMLSGFERFELVSDLMKNIHETFFVYDWTE